MTDAADEIERLRAELARINGLAVHLSSGGRDPDEKCYTKRDVEALIAITRAVEKKHDTKRRGDKSYLDGKGGHFWTCAKCQYVNDAGIRFNRCGECGEFQSGYADTRSGEPHG
jgi:rubrerythrin